MLRRKRILVRLHMVSSQFVLLYLVARLTNRTKTNLLINALLLLSWTRYPSNLTCPSESFEPHGWQICRKIITDKLPFGRTPDNTYQGNFRILSGRLCPVIGNCHFWAPKFSGLASNLKAQFLHGGCENLWK